MPRLRDLGDELDSAYLRAHATNPVEWWTWSADAFAEARRLDRPIFLSVGYNACHWCHVMAHETFEDVALAQQLNESFLSIKVDREERPDVDALYLQATQLVAGHGGWPMSVFLLDDGRPFLAGTYYPPRRRGAHVGFDELLRALNDAWRTKRDVVLRQADELTSALTRALRVTDRLAPAPERLDLAALGDALATRLIAVADAEGGFGAAPKFPRPDYVDALFDVNSPHAREVATRTLYAMAYGGLYDHLEGGFARYSVDAEWHVPHFEKMLSDQALLARCYLRAAREAPGGPWRDVALATLDFVERDLRVASGYAASLDADAGGVEGAHVTWSVDEVVAVTDRDDAAALVARYRLDDAVLEGRAVPRLAPGEPWRTPTALESAVAALRSRRAERPAPARDEKVVLEWNAMLASALVRTDDPTYVARGLALLASLARTHFDGQWWRTEHRRALAGASDVAWLLDATLDAFELNGDDHWLDAADELAEYLLAHYWDGPRPTGANPDRGQGLFSSHDDVGDLLVRAKEYFDGATPAAHSVAIRALARLALCRGDGDLLSVAQRLVTLSAALLVDETGSVPVLLAAAGYALEGVEIVVPGAAGELARLVRWRAMPRAVLVTGAGSSPLLAHRERGWAYLCRGGVCRTPVDAATALEGALTEVATWRS